MKPLQLIFSSVKGAETEEILRKLRTYICISLLQCYMMMLLIICNPTPHTLYRHFLMHEIGGGANDSGCSSAVNLDIPEPCRGNVGGELPESTSGLFVKLESPLAVL